MLESYYHVASSFVTLTYDDSCIPMTDSGVQILCKQDLQRWLKRLRKRIYPRKIRFFACGEYGSKTARPHYHAILFGIAPEELDPWWQAYGGKSGPERRTPLFDTWQMGLVHVGECTRQSVQYVAGYVTKKLTTQSGKIAPEFCTMSRRPGIAAYAVDAIASALTDIDGRQLRIDGKKWPMGRFLLSKLKETLGRDFTDFDKFVLSMRQQYFDYRRSGSGDDFVSYLVSMDNQRVLNMAGKQSIYNTRSAI